MIKIGIDIDEVLTPTNLFFIDWFNKKHGTSFSKEDLFDYNYTALVGFEYDFIFSELYYFIENCMDSFLVEDGAVDVLCELKKKGFKLVVLTSRSLGLKECTMRWLNDNFGEGFFDEIVIYNEHSNMDICKSKVCLDKKIDLIIEDAPHYVKEISAVDIFVLVMDQPWNRNIVDGDCLKRVSSWIDIGEEIEKKFSLIVE